MDPFTRSFGLIRLFLFEIFFLFLFFILPVILTAANTILLFKGKKPRKVLTAIVEILIFSLGIPFTGLLWFLHNILSWGVLQGLPEVMTEWGEYSPVAIEYMPAFLAIALLGLIGYLLARIGRGKLPLPVLIPCYCATLIGCVLSAVCLIQLSVNLSKWLMCMFALLPANYIFCTVRLMHSGIPEAVLRVKANEQSSPALKRIQSVASTRTGFVLILLLGAVLMLAVTIAILTLLGQAPDALIRSFTQTSKWTFSML